MDSVEALRLSYEKWWRNSLAETPDEFTTGADSCPLCSLYHRMINESVAPDKCCHGCPVMKFTGKDTCRNTPYLDAGRARYIWKGKIDVHGDEAWDTLVAKYGARRAARVEACFLAGLGLPY
jgi:hypothetical protein